MRQSVHPTELLWVHVMEDSTMGIDKVQAASYLRSLLEPRNRTLPAPQNLLMPHPVTIHLYPTMVTSILTFNLWLFIFMTHL